MKAEITKIEYPKVTLKSGDEEKEYQVEPHVKKEYLKLGEAEISFNAETKMISFITMVKDIPMKPKDGEKKGFDDMVDFDTLMSKAHSLKTPFSIETEMLAVDLEKKYALFKAKVLVHTSPGKDEEGLNLCFEAHGDATADNIKGEFIKPHFIRMAETRAIVRALRWYTNNAEKCAEEEKS